MNKIIATGIIAYLSIISLSAQTQYWNGFREPSGKLGAVYLSEDETQEDRIERRFYTKRGRKLVDAQILSLDSPHEIIGQIYFYPNGQVSQEILYDESGFRRKSVHYWNESGNPTGAEHFLADSSSYTRNRMEYPNGQIRYRSQINFTSFNIQKAGWYPNGKRWFEQISTKGIVEEYALYDSSGLALDLSSLEEEEISWELEPKIQNRNEILRRIGYPQIARAQGLEGKVRFRLLISPEGKVLTYKLMESPGDILTIAVELYLWDLAYSPAQSGDGQAVYAWVDFNASFKLLE